MEGKGILVIKDANMGAFNTLLSQYYETGNAAELKVFMYDNCIDGIEFEVSSKFGAAYEKLNRDISERQTESPDEPEL